MTEKRARTSIGGYGRAGGRDSSGAGRRGRERCPPFTRRMNCSTSVLRGFLSHGITNAAVAIADPAAVAALADVPIGGTRRLSIGGKGSRLVVRLPLRRTP